jgi:hypothetical protein
MWKNKGKNQEESLLKELSGDDAKLYDFLSRYLYENPLVNVSKEDLDILIKEAEKSGDFRPAIDKAIFDGAQKPGEREKYVKVLQNLASKTMYATEKEKERAGKEGLTAQAASLGRRIESEKFMSERAEDIIDVASKFYNERLIELGENVRREARKDQRTDAEWAEKRTVELEKAGREASRQERKTMGKEEKKEAEKRYKIEEQAAKDRKKVRAEEKKEAQREEKRTSELEKTEREARKKGRKEN